MDVIERAELARSLKATGKCNCAQSVISALIDLTDADINTLLPATSGFAAGMGNMEGTCGAFVGANIILGLIVKQGTVRYSKMMMERFKELTGAVQCKVIKGIETGEVLTPCPQCCYNAVIAFFDVINNL
ncbi:MAG: C-GCAxxG-C-C family protein [Acholeplasmatales bacterium]|nr:C-GCAxxG-C-C family protein [Acholeplasmatales bacterium]